MSFSLFSNNELRVLSYELTISSIAILFVCILSFLPNSVASLLLSSLVNFEGIKMPFTFSGPKASTATHILNALSIPPEIPTTTPGNLFLAM